ncbi:MAG TPA: hypothetical protein VHW47_08530, partial [Acidimicrobiales bacterium]|nr:hypothetical protein [Acidimicrobiales bacterium]
MGTVERDGITLVYDEVGGATGDGAAGGGTGSGERPMLLIHGMSCDRLTMGKQLEHFGPTRRTVAYDQRGHGDSDKPLDAAYDPAALADDAR